MEVDDNFKTASVYINNQLLSRGLLRDGRTIDFARPHKGDGGLEATMGRIMTVVNDLILRRDRDAAQRESLTSTIRSLHADAHRQTTDLERLQTRHADTARKVALADASERTLRLQLRTAEAALKGLRDEMARMRLLVAQTRAQCANEVRKRERTIEGLKKHVADGARPRGSGKPVGQVVITVVPGVGAKEDGGKMAVEESGYDLRSETNEFLTALARGLSEENETLGELMRRTVRTLQEVSGCAKRDPADAEMVQMQVSVDALQSDVEEVIEHLRTLLTNPSFVPIEEVEMREEEICRLRDGWDKMENRWKDAVAMMEGWRKRMATSGQTVNLEELDLGLELSPLKNTEHRMGSIEESNVDADIRSESLSEDDFSDSDDGLEEEDRSEAVLQNDADQSNMQEDTLETMASSSPGLPPNLSPLKETNGNRGPPSPREKAFTTIMEENTWDLLQLESSAPMKTSRSTSPQKRSRLEDSGSKRDLQEEQSGTTRTAPRSARRLRSSSPKGMHGTSNTRGEEPLLRPINTPPTAGSPPAAQDPDPSKPSTTLYNAKLDISTNPSSRLPRPSNEHHHHHLAQQSPLTMATIAAKLAATEREADAARVRAKLRAARAGRGAGAGVGGAKAGMEKEGRESTGAAAGGDAAMGEPGQQQQQRMPTETTATTTTTTTGNETKREARSKRAPSSSVSGVSRKSASRRRSTLSPWELESLMLGGAGVAGD